MFTIEYTNSLDISSFLWQFLDRTDKQTVGIQRRRTWTSATDEGNRGDMMFVNPKNKEKIVCQYHPR